MKTWDKLLSCLIIAGVFITGYFGYQWWLGFQSVESLPAKAVETWNRTPHVETMERTIDATEAREESPVMSNENTTYEEGEEIGRLVIPRIEKRFYTYWGADDETLDRGVGLYVSKWTTTPDQEGLTVLSGHRDTVFTNLDQVETGDSIFLEFEQKRYEYQVEDIWITDAEDRTVIVEKDEAALTLTTCYPFDFVGSAPDRYIIESTLVGVGEIGKR
ncbi:class D sortase [Alteribacillus sp. JSM 102045]|uniref:class D sortase n=1 Tax=Alteribacillus sp. JSM 102045 TaxID=1562101 RepID=UPI0035BF3263